MSVNYAAYANVKVSTLHSTSVVNHLAGNDADEFIKKVRLETCGSLPVNTQALLAGTRPLNRHDLARLSHVEKIRRHPHGRGMLAFGCIADFLGTEWASHLVEFILACPDQTRNHLLQARQAEEYKARYEASQD